VTRDELIELHYITPIANVASVLRHGILSHRRARRFAPQSIAMQVVQDRRAGVRVPGGRMLHEYANLYVCARNPMLFKRRADHERICVLRVSPAVLDLPDVVVTDQNAASGYCRFEPAPVGLRIIDRERTFAEYWTHPDNQIAEWRHKAVKCAEVLVPDLVAPPHILGAYVSGEVGERALRALQPPWEVAVDAHLFFR